MDSLSRLLGLLVVASGLLLQGCVVTKVVTVPMRMVGSVTSVIPGVGDTIDSSIDTVADLIDDIPL